MKYLRIFPENYNLLVICHRKFEHLESTGSDQGNMKGRGRGDIKSEYVMKITATQLGKKIKEEIACDYRSKMV